MNFIPEADETLGLTATAQVTDLIPADTYSEFTLEALYANRQLSAIISVVREDMTAKAGTIVQVPYMARRTLPGTVAEGATVAAANTTTGTYPITISKLGDRDTVNAEVWEDQTIFDAEDFVANMAAAFAEKVDDLCYDEVETAAAGSVATLTAAGNLASLYDKLVDLKAAMKKLKVKPTLVVIGPDQEAQFLKDTSEGIKEQQISVSNGSLLRVAGLDVIVTPLANANAATIGLVQAIVLDTKRALGEAWGRRPQFTKDYINTNDTYEVVGFIRYGVAELDVNAIGHVKNP